MNIRKAIFEIVPGSDDQRRPIFSVLVKRSYRIRHGAIAERCAEDRELRKVDFYYDNGDPTWSTVQYEAELAPYKPSVDFIVIGKAYAPRGAAVQQMTAEVRIGHHHKAIAVFGDRELRFRSRGDPLFSEPAPFTSIGIRYEHAYGGHDEKSVAEIPFFYPRNHAGRGVVLRNRKDTIEGLPLPNLEDPADLLTPERIVIGEAERWHQQPLPQGFGWFSRTWYPRCALLGAYPPFTDVGTATREEQAGLLPRNHIALAKQFKLPSFDARFNNGASFGLALDRLRGTERVALSGLSPDGPLEFTLPGEVPRIGLDLGSGAQPLETRLHTVSVRPDDLELDLIWSGTQPYDGVQALRSLRRLQAEVS